MTSLLRSLNPSNANGHLGPSHNSFHALRSMDQFFQSGREGVYLNSTAAGLG